MIRVVICYQSGEVKTRDFTNWLDALDYVRELVSLFYWVKKVVMYEIET